MKSIQLSSRIEAPIVRVFDAFTDLEAAPERISGIQSLEILTDGPVGKGTRFRETRIMFKREATEEMEISAFDPQKSYAVSSYSCGAAFLTTFDFAADGEQATEVKVAFNCRAVSFFAKLMSPLSALMSGSIKKCLAQDLEDLKKMLETTD